MRIRVIYYVMKLMKFNSEISFPLPKSPSCRLVDITSTAISFMQPCLLRNIFFVKRCTLVFMFSISALFANVLYCKLCLIYLRSV